MARKATGAGLNQALRQQQFLEVIDRDEAVARFHRHLTLQPLGTERVPLSAALNRILAADVLSEVDVPGFDRSNVDGFAVQAADTFGAMEESPRCVTLNSEILAPGIEPQQPVEPGTATPIATGAMVPRGADAVVMIEETELVESADQPPALQIMRAASPGQNISFAGSDIGRGETVLRRGQLLTSREIGVLAAVGMNRVEVYRRPQVAIISTGNEIVAPGKPRLPGYVYDSNAAILSAAVAELGGEPIPLGIVTDDEQALQKALDEALRYDVVVLSGGTSKGAGDLSYRVVASRLKPPGIVAHGVALKPGKPICLAVSQQKPVVILPGFPTSAIFTFHEFVAPVIRALGGQPQQSRRTVSATLPIRVNSERGRTEYLLVGLVGTDEEVAAYPLGKGSGSVTAFSFADGFITIGQQTEIVEAGTRVDVQLLGDRLQPADLVVIGSHCVGLDFLLGELRQRGCSTKTMYVGSNGGLAAAKRGQCDLAGIHLMDPDTGQYNRPFLTDELELIEGYRRMQGLVFRRGDPRFEGKTLQAAIEAALNDPDCTMINRNAGSGTRILIDRLLEGRRPPGYPVAARSHNAVAAAIVQQRADWGMTIETVARDYGLGFLPVQQEHYDFVVPKSRLERPAVLMFQKLLQSPEIRKRLQGMGFGLQQE